VGGAVDAERAKEGVMTDCGWTSACVGVVRYELSTIKRQHVARRSIVELVEEPVDGVDT
jgi:hypothetical protein